MPTRSELHELHTAERWRREGRAVRHDELGQPAKEAKKRGAGLEAGKPMPMAAGGRGASQMLLAPPSMHRNVQLHVPSSSSRGWRACTASLTISTFEWLFIFIDAVLYKIV